MTKAKPIIPVDEYEWKRLDHIKAWVAMQDKRTTAQDLWKEIERMTDKIKENTKEWYRYRRPPKKASKIQKNWKQTGAARGSDAK